MSRDPHEARKDFIESEMIAGRNPPRIMSDFKTPEEKKLADALADSALKTVRILELEKEISAVGTCRSCGKPVSKICPHCEHMWQA